MSDELDALRVLVFALFLVGALVVGAVLSMGGRR